MFDLLDSTYVNAHAHIAMTNMCSMMQWLHTLLMHNFHETAARLKNAESATSNSVEKNGSREAEHSDPKVAADQHQPVVETAPAPSDPADTSDPSNTTDLSLARDLSDNKTLTAESEPDSTVGSVPVQM